MKEFTGKVMTNAVAITGSAAEATAALVTDASKAGERRHGHDQ